MTIIIIEAILAALSMAAVEPVKAKPKRDPATWVRAHDLPRISKDAAVTTFDLTVDRSGDPVRCAIVVESGANDLDAAVCKAVIKRAKFRPATDTDGLPVFSVRRDRVYWLPRAVGANSSFDDADVVITSPDASGEGGRLAEVLLTFDEGGRVSSCKVIESSGINNLDALTCRVASDPQIALPITDASGQQVPGLRSLFIAFENGPSLSARIR